MFGNVVHNLLLLSVSQFHFDESSVQTNSLCTTGSHHFLGVHVVERILNR